MVRSHHSAYSVPGSEAGVQEVPATRVWGPRFLHRGGEGAEVGIQQPPPCLVRLKNSWVLGDEVLEDDGKGKGKGQKGKGKGKGKG